MGADLGNYQTLTPLYHEPVGTVHLGRHRLLERDVHLLLLRDEYAANLPYRRRFLREMRAVARLNHPHITRVLDLGESGQTVYLVLEAETGTVVSTALLEGGPMAPIPVFRLGVTMCNALLHGHLKGVLHRNLSPASVWIRPDGHPVVRGYGLGRPADVSLASTSEDSARIDEALLPFRAPETLEGRPAQVGADVWSLGAVLFYLLVGSPPFPGRTPEEHITSIREGRVEFPPAVLRDLPAEALQLFRRMLSPKVEDRPLALYEVKAALREVSTMSAATVVSAPSRDKLEVGARFEAGEGLEAYEIVEKLGEGGCGTVYKVKDPRSQQFHAMKVMKPDLVDNLTALARFQHESEALRAVSHPNIVKVLEVGSSGGLVYFVMDYVDGTDLRRLIAKGGRLPWDQAVRIAIDISRALEAAHAAGIVHRDLTPSNVLLDRTDRVILTDFGLALLPGRSRLTMTGDILGTPSYLAPEIVNGLAPDARTDLYALGVILYEMLTGKPPFEAENVWSVFRLIVGEDPPLHRDAPADTPEALKGIVLRLLEKDMRNRHANATELLGELTTLEAELLGARHGG